MLAPSPEGADAASYSMSPPPTRRLGAPRPVAVRATGGGVPEEVGGLAVEGVREEWVVEDRWWTRDPLKRRYFELILSDGRNTVVFRDLVKGDWFSQRA
jgi:hypothetical protein